MLALTYTHRSRLWTYRDKLTQLSASHALLLMLTCGANFMIICLLITVWSALVSMMLIVGVLITIQILLTVMIYVALFTFLWIKIALYVYNKINLGLR